MLAEWYFKQENNNSNLEWVAVKAVNTDTEVI